MKVGVVGIGKMGRPIADRLITAGHDVAVCNRSENAGMHALRERGATVHASPAELASVSEVVLTALPTEDSVRQVYMQMTEVARSGQVYVDHSTVSPALNRHCAETLATRDASFLDAPVSGGPAGAEKGTLTVMVGGDEATFNRMTPLLEAFGAKIRLCGPVGAGQAIKLVNQYLVAVHTMADVLRQFSNAAAQPAAVRGSRLQPRNPDRVDCQRPLDHPLGGDARGCAALPRRAR
jgi:3-hydroxyisobutyrate dehydrogenase-like beta-hydroxyacid dehydrogenase